MTKLSDLLGSGGGGVPLAATAFAKPSIILFETRPGTRTWTVPQGVTQIRAFVVGAGGNGISDGGAGGGYSEKIYDVTPGATIDYTVGESPGGTSSFAGPGGTITATGGANNGGAGGTGSGGDVNSNGGDGGNRAGGSSGHRFGNGIQPIDEGGAGWGDSSLEDGGSSGGLDGFGLGVVPGARKNYSLTYATEPADTHGYGCGGGSFRGGGIGGGGGQNSHGGIGGGGGRNNGIGGFGLVGVEWLE